MTTSRNVLVLNVSPDQAGRHALSQMLKKSEVEVREAATSAEALRPRLEPPDLIRQLTKPVRFDTLLRLLAEWALPRYSAAVPPYEQTASGTHECDQINMDPQGRRCGWKGEERKLAPALHPARPCADRDARLTETHTLATAAAPVVTAYAAYDNLLPQQAHEKGQLPPPFVNQKVLACPLLEEDDPSAGRVSDFPATEM